MKQLVIASRPQLKSLHKAVSDKIDHLLMERSLTVDPADMINIDSEMSVLIPIKDQAEIVLKNMED